MRSRGFFLALATRSVQIVRVVRRSFRATVSRPTFFSFHFVLTISMCRISYEPSIMVNNYQRRFLIDHTNHRSYNIAATIDNVIGLYGEMADPENPLPFDPAVRDSVIAQLRNLQYVETYDLDDLIIDIFDAMYVQLFEFLRRYGVQHHWFPLDGSSSSDESPYDIMDFPVDDMDFTDDSTITEEDEAFLVNASVN